MTMTNDNKTANGSSFRNLDSSEKMFMKYTAGSSESKI